MSAKEPAITWIKDITPINITTICEKIEDESLGEEWSFFFNRDKLEEMANRFLNDLNFHDLDMVHNYGKPVFYWCGAFTAEPWCELNETEEEIMNWINQDFLRVVVEEGEVKIKFINNSKGETRLYRWFLREDVNGYSNRTGWGGNIVASINDALNFAKEWLEERIRKFSEQYGDWSENTPEPEEDDA